MIERAQSYKTSDGETFLELKDAQTHEIQILLQGMPTESVTLIVANAAVLVDILTTTGRSKNKARKINGGTKKRKAQPENEAV